MQPSVVRDDFGDVYGVFFAVTGDGYSYAELMDYADFLKKELLLVKDVAKIEYWGVRSEAVYVEFSRARMSQLGISPDRIFNTLGRQNLVSNSGRAHVGEEYIRFDPTGMFDSVQDIGELLIQGTPGRGESLVYLKDIATVRRGYLEPPGEIMTFDGKPALGLGISTALGGNVVQMGEGIKRRLQELESQTPVGMELGVISFQGDDVSAAINAFNINLVEAILIVLVVLMAFMGWRSAVLIGGILLITILSTFVFMSIFSINLQRISLGALIIALGMLVDNAIVVVEGILIGVQKGMSRVEAAIDTVGKTAVPLLGATVVAILAFAAIGVSQDATGEFCRALFQVIMISLGLSWVYAVTVTPLVGTVFLQVEPIEGKDPYAGKVFQLYRGVLISCIRRRRLTVAAMAGLFVASLYGFGFVKQSFFPDSTRPQFYVDFWRPEGSHIQDTAADIAELDQWIRTQEGVTSTATFTGRGAMRFMLTYTAEDTNSAFGHIIIQVEDARTIDALGTRIQEHVQEHFPDAQAWYKKFVVGPGGGAKVEAKFRGPDAAVLRQLAGQARTIMENEPLAANIRDDWRQRVKVIRLVYAETAARLSGITRPDLAGALQAAFDGRMVGLYREEKDLLPILFRAPEEERSDVYNVNNIQIWPSLGTQPVPLNQVVSRIETTVEDSIIRRFNRMRTIETQADQASGTAEAFRRRIVDQIEAIELPPGYEFKWDGEYGSSLEAQGALLGKIPVTFLLMVLVVVVLFDNLRQPLIIYLTLPLALIGVTVGLLVTDNAFGFMAMLGFLSLSGMLIKNAIVLIDETDILIREGMDQFEAVVLAGVSRARPVAMAALTTMLGMIPLFQDAFFVSMAVTIVFGLGFATVLTLVVVPTLYALFFKVPNPDLSKALPVTGYSEED